MKTDERYLHLLSNSYPTVADAAAEIINLEAILNLPKGTEHFLADLHGEHEAFIHVLKNASGNIKRKVSEIFGTTIRESEKKELCTLIYYPEQKLELIKATEDDIDDWYHITIHQLVRVCRDVSSKYTRSKVRKSLPEEFSYIIEELLHERSDDQDKAAYVAVIVDTIISTGRADDFIVAICNVIQRLAIDQLHILGDIYDRGPGAHIIMDTLRQYHSWDIQWGNHDILWMGAAAGNDACICNVLRLSLRYANLATLEEGYGINLVPLATFALEVYGDDPCEEFIPKELKKEGHMDEKTLLLTARMHKAISVIQFKEEARIFHRRPEWQMEDRCLLEKIDFIDNTCTVDGVKHSMKSMFFPTIDPKNPSELTAEEEDLMKKLHHSFRVSEKLRKHIRTILSHGCMYNICNQNLLFHASVPLNSDGTLKSVPILGKEYAGKELMHYIGQLIRSAFQNCLTDPDMLEVILVAILFRLYGSAENQFPELLLHGLEHQLHDHGIERAAAGLRHCQMKRAVRLLGDHSNPGFLPKLSKNLLENLSVFPVQMESGLPGDVRLQNHTCPDDLLRLHALGHFFFRGLRLDIYAAALDGIHQPVQFQRTERLSHGNPAHIEGLTQLLFTRKFVSDRKPAFNNRVMELIVNLNV
mgnify:CR=1 FL=1